jgi:hypothetical protein
MMRYALLKGIFAHTDTKARVCALSGTDLAPFDGQVAVCIVVVDAPVTVQG